MDAGQSSQGRILKVTYEMVKDPPETFFEDAHSIADQEEFESNTPSPNFPKSRLKPGGKIENRLWENLSFSSNFSIQILHSDQPFRNFLKGCNFYFRRHLKLILFVLLTIFILAIIILFLLFSLRDPIDFNEEEEEESILKILNLTDTETSNITICTHQLCKVKSKSLLSSLNKLVKPCENFSKFACENYNAYLPDNHIDPLLFFTNDWTSLSKLSEWAFVQLKRMLEDTNDISNLNVSSISKAAEFYGICRRNFDLESTTNRDLKQDFIAFFKVDWPISDEPDSNKTFRWSFENTLGNLLMNGIKPFIKIEIVYHKALEKNIISLDAGDLTYKGTKKQVKGKYQQNSAAYVRELMNAASMLEKQTDNSEWAEEVWSLEKHLFEITYNYPADSPTPNNRAVMTIGQLQNMFAKRFDFKLLFSLLFKRNFSSAENVLIKNVYYFENLSIVLASTHEKSKANFASWLYLMKICVFLPAEFSNYLTHVTKDINRGTENCLRATVDVFPSTIASLYAIKKDISQRDVEQIQGVFSRIVEELVTLVEGQVEMKNKKEVVAKVRKLELEIVKKQSDVDYVSLNKHYQSVVLKQSAIENYLLLKSKRISVMFSALDKNINVRKISPFDSSVFLHERQSTLQIPLALLQRPIYQSIYPTFLTYSALGSIISHHVAHSLENLDDLSIKECLEDQLKRRASFQIDNLGEKLVVSELIADNVGLRTAYNAYKKQQSKGSEEGGLSGNKFNKEQLFFINYAQTWCRNKEPNEWMDLAPNYDYHQPSRHRVNNVLKNMPEFAEAFNCPSLEHICLIKSAS